MGRWIVFCLIVFFIFSEGIVSQEDATGTPTQSFDVASIHVAKEDPYKPMGVYVYPGGKVIARQVTLKQLVEQAYDVQDFEIFGEQSWMSSDLFDISAVPPDDSIARKLNPSHINDALSREQRQMLQSLLRERFGLKTQRVERILRGASLARTKQALLLQPSKHPEFVSVFAIGGRGNGPMSGMSVTTEYMALRLGLYFKMPIENRTHLDGKFDFKAELPMNDRRDMSDEEFLSEIIRSLNQLGLNLHREKVSVSVINVLDAHHPSEN